MIRLEHAGFGIGQRIIELTSCRDRLTRRETRIVNMLQVGIIHIRTTIIFIMTLMNTLFYI